MLGRRLPLRARTSVAASTSGTDSVFRRSGRARLAVGVAEGLPAAAAAATAVAAGRCTVAPWKLLLCFACGPRHRTHVSLLQCNRAVRRSLGYLQCLKELSRGEQTSAKWKFDA